MWGLYNGMGHRDALEEGNDRWVSSTFSMNQTSSRECEHNMVHALLTAKSRTNGVCGTYKGEVTTIRQEVVKLVRGGREGWGEREDGAEPTGASKYRYDYTVQIMIIKNNSGNKKGTQKTRSIRLAQYL